MRTLIRNGTVVNAGGAVAADILVDGETIAAVTAPGVIEQADTIIDATGRYVLPGGIDAHIHFIAPQQAEEALASGITTWVGGGTGPATGTNATTCTPGAWNLARMLEAVDHPVKELTRTSYGPIRLGRLRPGSWRRLRLAEVESLRRAVGLES